MKTISATETLDNNNNKNKSSHAAVSWADRVKRHMPSDTEKKQMQEKQLKLATQRRWTERERNAMRETRLANHSTMQNDDEMDEDETIQF